MDGNLGITADVYRLLQRLTRFRHPIPMAQLPFSGIYFFFEEGETVDWNGREIDRVVRIGTHREDSRFRARIRQHYGRVRSLGGNKNGSVFRMHLGAALLSKEHPSDPRLNDWLRHMGQSDPQLEMQVSTILRERFSFSCLRVDDRIKRLGFERSLIGLFAHATLGAPSREWLGRYAASEKIRRTGLWNTQHIDGQPLNTSEFQRLEQLVALTLSHR